MSPTKNSQSAEGLLARDHEALDKLLNALLAALDKRDAPTAFAHLDLFWARLAMHIRAEHLHLFPAILTALRGDNFGHVEISTPAEARETIAQLHRDHDFFMHELAVAIKVMRNEITAGVDVANHIEGVRQVITTVRDRLEVHNKLEEGIVYRLPARLFEPVERVALARQIRGELENLPPRFRADAGDG